MSPEVSSMLAELVKREASIILVVFGCICTFGSLFNIVDDGKLVLESQQPVNAPALLVGVTLLGASAVVGWWSRRNAMVPPEEALSGSMVYVLRHIETYSDRPETHWAKALYHFNNQASPLPPTVDDGWQKASAYAVRLLATLRLVKQGTNQSEYTITRAGRRVLMSGEVIKRQRDAMVLPLTGA
jgi:hypothetical protein